MMNFEEIITQKIQYLNGETSQDLDDKMQAIVEANPELQAEIEFIETIWQSQSLADDHQPSPALDARFYQMLSLAQSSQSPPTNDMIPETKKHWLDTVSRLFSLKPLAQFALLVLVFFTGWNLNTPSQPLVQVTSQKLEEQIATLNAMVAMTMLRDQSATERLAGVTYSAANAQNDTGLNDLLLELLINDNSSAVRLAIVDALAKRNNLHDIQSKLMFSIKKQNNPLVQMSLIRLAIQKQILIDENTLSALLNDQSIDTDVKDYIRENRRQLTGRHSV